MTKLKLILLLLVITLASKLTTANEGLFQSELQIPQLIPLVNKLNLKETTLFQGSAHLNTNDNVLQFENAAVKEKFQKEQAKLMSFKKPTATDANSKLEVARRLNNSLRLNRLQMIENDQELGVPKMMVSYLRSKNRNELSKLSKANLLPTEPHLNVKIAEIPSFLKVNNHQRLLHKLEDDNDGQISVKKNENTRTLSGNNRDKKYFQSIEYTTNRLNNTLRNYRLDLSKKSPADLNDVPTVLAMYIKKKIENERNQLVNRGIIPESYEEAVSEAPSLRPTPRAAVAVNKPRGRAQIVHEDEEEEEEEEEEEYEVATTKKTPSKPNFLVVIDENKASKQRGLKKPKVKAPEPEYETYEYEIKPKNRPQKANKNNNRGSNNPNRSNQARVNRPKPEPVEQLYEYYYDEEEVTTTTQAPTTTTTTKAAPRRRYNPRGNQNARASQPRRRVKPVEEPVYEEEEEEETTTRQSKLNQGYKHKTFRRRTTVAPETTTVSVVPEATAQTIVEETTATATEATTTVAAPATEPVPVVEQVTVSIETTTIAPVEESTTTEQVLVEETTAIAVPVDTTTEAVVQETNNKNLKAKRRFKQRVIVDKTSPSQSADQERPRINANAARQRITPTPAPAPVRQQSIRQRVNPQRLNMQNDNTQLRASPGSGQRFNNRNRSAAQYSYYN